MRAHVFSSKHQNKWMGSPIYDETIIHDIDPAVQLHRELRNTKSSAAACINTLGNIAKNKGDLIRFLNEFNLGIEDIIAFPSGTSYKDEVYRDKGNVVFEWIGPHKSPLNEKGGKRGQHRTSIDAFILAIIEGKLTQLLIEWKFTERYSGKKNLQKFAGIAGNERLRRYSNCLAKLRKEIVGFPFNMEYEGGFGLYDLGYEPFYQLLRMTLLAKLTTPFEFSNGLAVGDYRVIHLSHSENMGLNILSKEQLSYSPGLRNNTGRPLHNVWVDTILSVKEADKFRFGYWNQAIGVISDDKLRQYLQERYG